MLFAPSPPILIEFRALRLPFGRKLQGRVWQISADEAGLEENDATDFFNTPLRLTEFSPQSWAQKPTQNPRQGVFHDPEDTPSIGRVLTRSGRVIGVVF